MYSYEEVKRETLNYFKGDDLAANVWISKYCLKDNKGKFYEKSPEEMHIRMAREFFRIEKNYKNSLSENEIFELFKDFKYIIPQGSPMAGIGNNFLITSLSNCFVVDNPHDSYSGIFEAEQQLVSIMKRRGGVGLSIHSLRPKDMPTTSVSEKSSGIVLFSERYSRATREVAQDGRRGALMISCMIDHPDVLDFITAKTDLEKITGANVSVMITDEFMDAVKSGSEYTVKYNSLKGSVESKLDAGFVWKKIIESAHKSAEPGVLFWDTILKESPADCYPEFGFTTTSTNPCGEIPLCPGDSCRLMALNLFSYVKDPFSPNSKFDFDLFRDHVSKAQRLMDDMVDLEIEKINKVRDKIKNDDDPEHLKRVESALWDKILSMAEMGRRTGLGVTAEGDMLAALGLIYGTEESTIFSEEVHKVMAIESYKSSIDMAEERGFFPVWSIKNEKENPFIRRVLAELPEDYLKKYSETGRRNIANLTIAPTGSVSIMTQTTSGVEPTFLPYYKRRRKTNDPNKSVFKDDIGDMWEEYNVFHHKFIEWFNKNWYKLNPHWYDIDYKPDIETLSEEEINKIYKKSPYYKATANDVNWEEKVRMQGRIQKWVDHSISVTVNVPNKTSVETVHKIYMTAYESGCKGCTIYRDGSRSGVLIQKEKKSLFTYNNSPKRPKSLECDIYTKTALGRDFTVLVGLLEDKPYEVFAFEQLDQQEFPKEIKRGSIQKIKNQHYRLVGKRGDKEFAIDNIIKEMEDDERTNTRRYSLALRHGIKPIFIHEQIEKYAHVTSFDKVVSRVLKNYSNGEMGTQKCQACGKSNLVMQDGCEKCPDCGWAKC